MAKRIGIIGSGMVGRSLASGFAGSGYEVKVGSREPEKLAEWAQKTGRNVTLGTDSEAAAFGEIVVLATKWTGAKNAIELAGRQNFDGKIVIDVTNPLSDSQPPSLAIGYPESAGATVQKWLPNSKVVKAFNIVTAAYMPMPKLREGTPDMFIAGNDDDAKKTVAEIAKNWGWPVTDIGDISQAYLLEAMAMLWVRYGFLKNHWTHAWKLLRQ